MMDTPKKKGHPEVKGLLIIALALFLTLAHVSFIHGSPEKNWIGLIGYFVAFGSTYTFGLGSYLLIGYLSWIGWKFLTTEVRPRLKVKTLYFSLLTLSICMLVNVIADSYSINAPLIEKRVYSEAFLRGHPFETPLIRYNLGGVPLYYLYADLPTLNLKHLLSNVGVCITFSITGLLSLILFTNTRMIPLMKQCLAFLKGAWILLIKVIKDLKPKRRPKPKPLLKSFKRPVPTQAPTPAPIQSEPVPIIEEEPPEVESDLKVTTLLDRKQTKTTNKALTGTKSYQGEFKRYRLPPLSLITNARKVDQPSLKRDLKHQAITLEETLESFGITAKVGEINCGPTIASFEVHPPVGVKVQKIKVLENDIALNLQAKSIRIIAPIPGKAAVGVEVPSPFPQEVGFKEMLSEYHKGKKMHIPVLMGQTVTGENVVSDLTKMPHCIIAGATGSGKSVCINSIVMSILMTARPDEVRLLLVDPKKVELSGYSALPHMIAPVITEAHGAYAALNWLVKEMQTRYEMLKLLKLRNITAFNSRKVKPEKEEKLHLEIPRKMPYIVAIIDEFADLMMASSSDLETPIARIAQMARAVGIHLILATQRPSREVITGLIKANFPTRISFKVASRINSQIILDENGAETLLGNGDLLFLPPGSSQLIRAQGVFIRDEDINKVVEHIEGQAHTNYLIKSFDQMALDETAGKSEDPKDELYNQALTIVTQTGSASTTFLQRKLKIGYARAASLMDELESRGVISPQEGSRPRRVLIGNENNDM